MVETTAADGFAARFIKHWATPNYPDHASWRKLVTSVDEEEKQSFITKIKELWRTIGKDRGQEIVTR